MTYFKNSSTKDVASGLSLFLISLPITAGIAVASKVSPEAGLFSAIFGAMILGLFSSSELIVYGPAAGLSVFISAASLRWGEYGDVSAAISIAGLFLLIISYFPVHVIIHLFPTSVIKGLGSGIGLILVLKMIPHLLGNDAVYLTYDAFLQSDGRNTLSEIFYALQNASPTPVIISTICMTMVLIWRRFENSFRNMSYVIVIVLVASILGYYIGLIKPEWALNSSQMLHIESLQFKFKPFWTAQIHWWETLNLAMILTTVIVLEGLATIEVVQQLDKQHRLINPRREIFLMGIGNLVMGFINALPLMPVLIRSNANYEFGAKSRLSVMIHGLLLLIALMFYRTFSYIPMASVATILFMVGFNLFNLEKWKIMYKKGWNQFIPFAATVILMLSLDFLWGILAGSVIGLVITMRSSLKRTMVLVDDGDRYLLRFFKDVTYIHKIELIETLSKVPVGKEVIINGTGNIFVDSDIEEWLSNYQDECLSRDCKVTFIKSNLSVSKLFKE
jgi:MFS superfamily sulfate permease-like transporter